MPKVYRAFITQPNHMPDCGIPDRTRCIAVEEGHEMVTVYFTDGPVHSIRVPTLYISRIRLSTAG